MKPTINKYGSKYYRLDNKLHREDGPAIEWANGDKAWYINDQLHREDGHAYESANGHKQWYYHDKRIYCKNNEEFLRMIKLLIFI